MIDIEQIVLGTVIIQKGAFSRVAAIINENTFQDLFHKSVWESCIELDVEGKLIDLVEVAEKLASKKQSVDFARLSELTGRVGSDDKLEDHCYILLDRQLRRELSSYGMELVHESESKKKGTLTLLDEAGQKVSTLTQLVSRKGLKSTKTVVNDSLTRLKYLMDNPGLSGLSSGFIDIDKMTGGYQQPDMIVLAARPGMGKTAFMLANALNMAKNGDAVAIFTLEMSATQLINRLLASESGVDSEKLRDGNLTNDEYVQVEKAGILIESLPIYIDDTAGLNILELRASLRRFKDQHGVKMAFIDYIQLMTGNKSNREQEISAISRGIKLVAKELEIPIMPLSQLSRSVESRGGDKRPMLSDLRESGAIEQDADVVVFIFRPDYYGMTEDAEGNSVLGVAEIIYAKHRNGKLGTVEMRFIGATTEFRDINESKEINQMTSINPSIDF